MFEQPNRGNLGLASSGIEIYFPLSPTRALAMNLSDPEGVAALSNALRSDKVVQYSVANVENFNSLQVAWSERYIFSTLNDFRLASEMLEVQPRLRSGPRVAMS